MKMLMIVFRQSLEEDVLKLIRDLGVTAFTELPSVVGAGASHGAYHAFHTFPTAAGNSIVLTALSDDQAEKIITGLQTYREQLTQQQKGAYVPLRVFVLPCDQAV